MKITCTKATEKAGVRSETICTVELPDDALKSGDAEPQQALKAVIEEIFDGLK